jgi:hypothetical protein
MSEPPYKTGRGRPPKESQFKKGQSGNPAGRPKGARGVRDILHEELMKEIAAKENGQSIRIPALSAITRTLVNQAIRGDVKVSFGLIDLSLRIDAGSTSTEEEETAALEDAAIIAAALERKSKAGGGV